MTKKEMSRLFLSCGVLSGLTVRSGRAALAGVSLDFQYSMSFRNAYLLRYMGEAAGDRWTEPGLLSNDGSIEVG